MSPNAEVTRLDATDLSVEVPSHAQKKIIRGRYLGAIIHCAEISATYLGADLRHTDGLACAVLQCFAAFPVQCFATVAGIGNSSLARPRP